MSELSVLELYRVPSKDLGTFGVLLQEYPICNTLERPWRDNLKGVSSIPAGLYICNRVAATNKIPYEHFLLSGVPGRDGIAIHKGNTIEDIEGCILVGVSFGNIAGVPAVLQSGIAYDLLMGKLKGINAFRLAIKDAA